MEDWLCLFRRAEEAETESRLWEMWVSVYPYMDKENYTPYEHFRDQALMKHVDRRSDAEILADVEAAKKELEGGGSDGT